MLSFALMMAQAFQLESDRNLEQRVLEIIRNNPQVIVDAVVKHQTARSRSVREAKWRSGLERPIILNVSGKPQEGPSDAPIKIIELADFQCAHCATAESTLNSVMSRYAGRIQVTFVATPPERNALSREAARAAWAAGQQGKFFEYKARLFSLTGKLQGSDLPRIAADLQLDPDRFERDRQSQESERDVESSLQHARQLGIVGTPTFVINGIRIDGAFSVSDFDELAELLEVAPTQASSQ